MTRSEQQAKDKRYADWREVYAFEIRERVKHWGDRRRANAKRAATVNRKDGLEGALFAPGGQDA